MAIPAESIVCKTAFLPLGLPSSDPFWSDAAVSPTSVRLQECGTDIPIDHAV